MEILTFQAAVSVKFSSEEILLWVSIALAEQVE